MKRIRLNENTLRDIIKESVKRVIKEAKHLQGAKELNDLGGSKATGKGKGKHLSAKTFNGNEFEKNADKWCGKHGCKRYTGKDQLDEMTSQDFEDDFNTNLRDKQHDDALSKRQFDNNFDKNLAKSKSEKRYRNHQNNEFNKRFK